MKDLTLSQQYALLALDGQESIFIQAWQKVLY